MSREKNESAEPKVKKPFYKKWWFWVIVAIILVSIISGIGGGDEEPQETETPVDTASQEQTSTVSEDGSAATAEVEPSAPTEEEPSATDEAEPEETASETDVLRADFAEAMGGGGVLFDNTVRNDVTGNWRLLRISSSEEIVNHAVDYYNAYFESDDEIHFVVNFTLGTTTRISCFADCLYVDELEYVDGEEHDADILASGELLKQYIVHLDSGEIEDITG